MKKLIIMCMVFLFVGIAGATIQLLPNTGFESYGDDGYGRIMPTGWDLWTEDWNWGNIPNVSVKTLNEDGIIPLDGNASFHMDTTGSTADIALICVTGQLGSSIGLGWYHFGGFVKGDIAAGDIGIDIFGPDWSFWWGGGAPLEIAEEWSYFGFDFQVTDPTANYNIRIKSAPGSSFLIDNVQLVTELPEPTAFVLLALGSLTLRKRK